MEDPKDWPEAQVVANYALRAADPKPLDDDGRFFSVNAPGGPRIVDLDAERDKFRDHPARKAGNVTVSDAPSFVGYVNKHIDEDATEVWADVNTRRVVAILDAHSATLANWCGHRATLVLAHTKAWAQWAALDGKLVDQATFAEHIEDRVNDIVRPSGADMLELAQSIEATIGVKFESSKSLSSGERQFAYREQVHAQAGRAGQLAIPRDLDLGIAPFEGGPTYKVGARFRYRITDGSLRLGFKLDRPEDVVRGAFLDVVADIASGVTAPVFNGVPS